jgi:hypothetical protein
MEGVDASVDFAAKQVLLRVQRGSPMASAGALQHEIRVLDQTYDPVLLEHADVDVATS